MSRPVLLDTDVLIDFLRGYDKAVSFVNVNLDRIISPIPIDRWRGQNTGTHRNEWRWER